MYLFYFNPNSYGEEAFVCAESPEDAKAALTKFYENKINKLQHFDKKVNDFLEDDYRQTLDLMVNCREGYTIDKFSPGEIVLSEIS